MVVAADETRSRAVSGLGFGDAHAAELAPPQVIARFGESVSPAQILDRQRGIGLQEEAHNLRFG